MWLKNIILQVKNAVTDKKTGEKPGIVHKKGKEIRKIPDVTAVVLADLHMCFYEDVRKIKEVLRSEPYDCVIFLGDIMAEDIKEFVPCAGGRPCLYILGNHDEWGQNNNIPGLTYIDGRTVSVNGVRISGVSGGPKYKEGPYGMRTEEEVREALSHIEDTDILISHESPYHLLNPNRSHAGFQAISDFLDEKRPPLHIFGHHHIDHEEIRNSTREVCVYGCAVITTDPYSVKKIL